MIADIAVTLLSAKLVGGVRKGAGAAVERVLAQSATGITAMLGAGVVASAFPKATAFLGAAVNLGVGWIAGSPLGYSPDWAGVNYVYPGTRNDAINNWISPAPTAPASSLPSSSSPPAGSSGPARR
jgi:hypothetical protein